MNSFDFKSIPSATSWADAPAAAVPPNCAMMLWLIFIDQNFILHTARSAYSRVLRLVGGEDLLKNERRIRWQAVAIANRSGADDQGLPERPALPALPGRLVHP